MQRIAQGIRLPIQLPNTQMASLLACSPYCDFLALVSLRVHHHLRPSRNRRASKKMTPAFSAPCDAVISQPCSLIDDIDSYSRKTNN
jgi:hypothetical protein